MNEERKSGTKMKDLHELDADAVEWIQDAARSTHGFDTFEQRVARGELTLENKPLMKDRGDML